MQSFTEEKSVSIKKNSNRAFQNDKHVPLKLMPVALNVHSKQ